MNKTGPWLFWSFFGGMKYQVMWVYTQLCWDFMNHELMIPIKQQVSKVRPDFLSCLYCVHPFQDANLRHQDDMTWI